MSRAGDWLRQGAFAVAWLIAGPAALAGHGSAAPSGGLLPTYRQECGTCHVAYPPALLPADAWRRLTAGLAQHFGADASLEDTTTREIAAWLEANAAAPRRTPGAPPQDRITRSAWFLREHREVPAAVWQSAAVKRPANCAACHPRAEQGAFDEHAVRIPR